MFNFNRISVEQAQEIIEQGNTNLIDIRDEASFDRLHIRGAQLIDQQNVRDFVANADKSSPLIVYCYHGNSSQSASQFFSEQGFTEVYSMDGGFDVWHATFPDTVESSA